jgi:putative ABC transport system permease protein
VLKAGLASSPGSSLVRQGLVAAQFAVLILMLTGVLVIERQTRFAMTQATGADIERLYRINVDPPCRGGFADAVAKLPGVTGTACSSGTVFMLGEDSRSIGFADGRNGVADMEAVDFGFLEQLHVKPLAGRALSPDHPRDALPYPPAPASCIPFGFGPPDGAIPQVMVDQTMVRALGAATPQRALGQIFRIRMNPKMSSLVQVVGVVPTLHFNLDPRINKPEVYFVDAGCNDGLTVKIAPGHEAAVIAGAAKLWTALGPPRPIRARFVEDYLRADVYAASLRQGAALTVLATIAVVLGVLGMFALAAFTAERRTKEIGVRKALGASTPDIVRLLLWSFARPVLAANLIAWPLGWWVLDRWLKGFSLHIALTPWLFLAAGAAALAIALVTVTAQALRVAAAKPVTALRYE